MMYTITSGPLRMVVMVEPSFLMVKSGLTQGHTMLSHDDYRQFRCIVRTGIYSPDDFEISTMDFIDRCQHIHANFTRVSILYKPTGVTRMYIAGAACYWLRNLEEDVRSKVYGSPQRS